MFSTLIKHYFIFLFTIYTAYKLLNKPIYKLKHSIFTIIFTFLLAMIPQIPCLKDTMFLYLLPNLILWIIVSSFNSSPKITFVIMTVAFGINYCIHALCSFISTFIFYFLTHKNDSFPFLLVSLVSSACHTIVIIPLLKKKRFKIGLPIFNMTNYLNIATILCIIFTLLPTYSAHSGEPFIIKVVWLLLFIFTLAFLIFWWQAQITKSYKQRLLMGQLESYRTSEPEKDAEIERLSTILHRNTNLIKALYDATMNGLRTDFATEEEQIETREKLLANLEKLAAECDNISTDYHRTKARTFHTKVQLLDDLLHHMDGEAIRQGITFQVYLGIPLKDYVPSIISESDLVHTVDDLLKNAFKSTRTCEKRMVQLQFYKLGKHFVIEVSDNGIPFEVRSLANMGIERLTTYEDGSGIGLMDIWSTKEKYRATYHLDEYAVASPFTKKISLTFDKKNRYSIRTFRKDEILQKVRRIDLQVYEDK